MADPSLAGLIAALAQEMREAGDRLACDNHCALLWKPDEWADRLTAALAGRPSQEPETKEATRVVSVPGSAHGDLPRGRTGDKPA
jgi:hypothetical protein